MRQLKKVEGLKVPLFEAQHFKEFSVGFDGTGLSASQVNTRLLLRGIQGGVCLNDQFSELGQSALYCVTECHSREDIDRLVATIMQMLGER
jgi:glycine dehydrogenase subunit 1